MSILLEALKKSEEQRQLGTTPTLQTPGGSGAATPRHGGRWIAVAMGVLAAGVMTWLGWSQFRPPAAPQSPAAEFAGVTNMRQGAPVAAGTDAGAAEPAAAAVRSSLPTAPEASPADAEPDPPASGSTRERTTEEAAKRRLLGQVRSYTAPEEPAAEVVDAGSPEPAAEEPGPTQPSGPRDAGALAEESAAAVARMRPSEPPVADTISYWQIPAETREGMPELRIRVLVYAERAEDRFLLVNNQRLREGEELESGLKLEEIRRDRAIFTYRDYRFHLKG